MNVASIISKAYRITNTNATTLLNGSSADVLADLNTAYGHRTLNILGVRKDFNHNIKEIYTDLISTEGLTVGQLGYNGEYPFESDTLRPIRVEVSYDGSTWKPCEVYDIYNSDHSEHNETDFNTVFDTSKPYVRFERNSYFIRPTKTSSGNVTKGLHIWTEKRQTDLTTGSPEFEQNLHDILAYDLAECELLMHPKKYSNEWRNDYRIKRAEVEALFRSFEENRIEGEYNVNPPVADFN
jgi:hypothetical protein